MATILIVDDEPGSRVRLNAILAEELGHEVFFASDGESAIDRHARIRPEVVVTDLVMPHLNGVVLIEHLKAVDPTCTIIAISGKAPEQLERALAAGASATLVKPVERDELEAVLETALGGSRFWSDRD